MIHHVPDQFIPLVLFVCTQRSLCQRSISVERCRGEGVVGGVCFAGANSKKNYLGGAGGHLVARGSIE